MSLILCATPHIKLKLALSQDMEIDLMLVIRYEKF